MDKPTKAKPKENPNLTDEERLARFQDMAREVEASDATEDFDKAFDSISKRHNISESR